MDEHGTASIAVLVVLFLATWTLAQALYAQISPWISRPNFRKQHGCQEPFSSYPHIPFLQGLDFVLESAIDIWRRRFTAGVHERFLKYGTTYVSHIFWGGMVNTIDPENLAAAMTTDSESWTIIPARRALVVKLFGSGIFANEGDEWRHSRMLIQRSMLNLAYQPEVLEQHFQKMLLEVKGHRHESFDFAPRAFQYSANAAKVLLIGRGTTTEAMRSSAEDQDNPFAEDFGTLVSIGRVITLFHRRLPFAANILFCSTYQQAKKRVFDLVDKQIKKAVQERDYKISGPAKSMSLVGRLVDQRTDETRIRSEALNMMLAGRDSVGITLTEVFYLLARHPTVWTKLRAEVHKVSVNKVPTQEDLKSMSYLNSIINEVLRLRPTLSVHGRQATQDTVLPRGGGPDGRSPLFVPRKTYLIYSNYALHRNLNVYGEDVDAFRPERWAQIAPKRFEYMSFGAGTRHCPGKKMAWTMIAYATARLAQEVEWIEPRDDQPWEEASTFSFYNIHGAKVAMGGQSLLS